MALEKTGAGLLRSILIGQGANAIPAAERILARSGAVDGSLLPHRNVLQKMRGVLIGDAPIKTLQQRFTQGGLLGQGGIIHGSLAIDPRLAASIKQQGLGQAIAHHPSEALGAALNGTFMLGIPAYAGMKAHERGESVGKVVGEGLGWTVGAPFQAAGSLIAGAAGKMGEKLLPKPGLPPIQAHGVPYAEPQLRPPSYDEMIQA